MICCGMYRDTPFCPNCGKALKVEPIHSLLAYLDARARGMATEGEKNRKLAADEDNPASRRVMYRRLAEQADRNLPKWVGWRDALKEILEEKRRAENVRAMPREKPREVTYSRGLIDELGRFDPASDEKGKQHQSRD